MTKPAPLVLSELKMNELLSFRIGTRQPTLLKVSTVYENESRFTATVLLDEGELLGRTTVRSYKADQLPRMKRASAQLIHKYEDLAGLPPLPREK